MAKSEPFAAVPRRVFEALEAHELTFNKAMLLTYLIHRCAGTGRTSAKLSTIKEQIRWPTTLERLRQCLHELEDDLWITLEAPNPGSTAPWSFGLRDAQTRASRLELGSKEAPGDGRANAAIDKADGSKEAPNAFAPKEVDVDVNDDVVDDGLLGKVDELGLSATQRLRWLQDRALTGAWLDYAEAEATIQNVVGFVDAKLKDGERPPVRKVQPKGRELQQVILDWLRNVGHEYPLPAVADEIEVWERKRRERLSDEQRAQIMERWRELQVAA